jgi:hypothetical protein
LTSTCMATKRDGGVCTLPSNESTGLCWAHDPANAERRRRGQSRGGKSKPTKEIIDIKRRLSDLADDVLAGRVERGDGAVVSQILNVYLRAVSVEMKVREQQELEERLEQLEEALERQREGGGRRWGM